MEWIGVVLFFFFGLVVIVSARNKAAQRERIKQAYIFNPPSPGSARFAGNRDLRKAGLFKGVGVPIGYHGHHALHYPGKGHLLTVAAARTGKGATLLVNALLSWIGSVM